MDETHPIFERIMRFWAKFAPLDNLHCRWSAAIRPPWGPSGTSHAGHAIRRIRSIESESPHCVIQALFFAESNSRVIPFRNSNRNRRDGSILSSLLVFKMSSVRNEDNRRWSYLRRGPRPMLFSNSDTSSPWRRTPVFAKMLRRCMRAVVRRIPIAVQHSSSDKPSIR